MLLPPDDRRILYVGEFNSNYGNVCYFYRNYVDVYDVEENEDTES
jgi:hypothetical protein